MQSEVPKILKEFLGPGRSIGDYLQDMKGILGLKFFEDENKLSAHLINLRNISKEHQERRYKFLIVEK